MAWSALTTAELSAEVPVRIGLDAEHNMVTLRGIFSDSKAR